MRLRKGYPAVLAALLMLLVGGAVQAQYDYWGPDEPQEHRFSLKGGVVFPLGDTIDSSEVIGGMEYNTEVYYGVGVFTLSADYVPVTSIGSFERRFDNENETVSLVPVLVNYRIAHCDEQYNARGWYAGFGVGAYFASDDIPEMGIEKDWSFAWQTFGGYNISRTIFVEGRFIAGTTPGDDGLAGVQVGVRF